MSKVKISQLPAAESLNGSESLPIVQNGETVKTTVQDVANLGVGNLQFANNGGLEFNISDELTTIYNSSITTGTSQTIGALSSQNASYWQGKTIVQVLDEILFPTQNPTYVIPTISFSTSTSPLNVEVGSPIASISLTGSGTKNDAGSYNTFTFYKAINGGAPSSMGTISPTTTSATSLPNQFNLTNQNNPNYTYTGTKTDTSYSSGFPLPTSSNTSIAVQYSLTGQYSAGNPNYKSNGSLDTRTALVRSANAPQAADSSYAPDNTITFTGYYPVYYGTSTASTLTVSDVASAILTGVGASKLAIGSSNGSITIPFGTDNTQKWMWFAVYRYNTVKTSWYNSNLNQGTIGVSLFNTPVIQSVTSQQGYWSAKDYNIYITKYKSEQFGNYIMS